MSSRDVPPTDTALRAEHKPMPSVGLGTWKLTGEECEETVCRALELGYRHIDTAEMYGNEAEIGRAIARWRLRGGSRADLFITTKVWPDNLTYEGVMASWKRSTEQLGIDAVDLYLIHWPVDGDMTNALRAFAELFSGGCIKSFGVSNFTVGHPEHFLPKAEALSLPVATNQVEFHPLLYQCELLEYCTKRGIVLTAYAPLACGAVAEHPVLRAVAAEHGVTPAQVALKWALQKGCAVIPKASSDEHLIENWRLEFALSPEEMSMIDGIESWQRQVNPNFAQFEA